MSEDEKQLRQQMKTDYPVIKSGEIDTEARILAVAWADEYIPGIAMPEKVKLASDFMNYARRVQARTKPENPLILSHLQKENERLNAILADTLDRNWQLCEMVKNLGGEIE